MKLAALIPPISRFLFLLALIIRGVSRVALAAELLISGYSLILLSRFGPGSVPGCRIG
jgi:hypothetical protein